MSIWLTAALTEDLFEQARPLFDSLERYATTTRNVIFTVGFEVDEHYEHVSFVPYRFEKVKAYRDNWPANRDEFICLENGEFLDRLSVAPHDVIIHIDADMIMHRSFSEDEMHMISNWPDRCFGFALNQYPYRSIAAEFERLQPQIELNELANYWPGIDIRQPCYNTGVIISKAVDYAEMSSHYLRHFEQTTQLFQHHAAGQLLMNHMANLHFTIKDLGRLVHNGFWFFDPATHTEDGKLYYNNELVLFNHTKFNEGYWL